MLAIKHILFPMDFSGRCHATVPFVEAMADCFGAKVTLLSVAQPVWHASSAEPGIPLIPDETLQEELQTALNGSLTDSFAGVPVERIAQVGDPAEQITEYAHTEGVDVIMMPTHGYGPFRSLLVGSVTAKVLHDAECAVWTAAHVEEPPVRAHAACRNILCAVDGTPRCTPLMQWATKFAAKCGATLRLVHVVPGAEEWGLTQMHALAEGHKKDVRARIEHLQRAAGVSAPLCITTGSVAAGVREEALRHGADMVVIGRGLLDETLGRLRTHAYGIIRASPCPVLSV